MATGASGNSDIPFLNKRSAVQCSAVQCSAVTTHSQSRLRNVSTDWARSAQTEHGCRLGIAPRGQEAAGLQTLNLNLEGLQALTLMLKGGGNVTCHRISGRGGCPSLKIQYWGGCLSLNFSLRGGCLSLRFSLGGVACQCNLGCH